MTTTSTFRTVAGAAALALPLAALALPAAAQEAIRIGTSSVGSVFYTIAIGASEIITKHAKINSAVQPVGGSSANMRGLAAKKIEFALGNAFAAFTAYNGTHNFKKPVEIRMAVQGQPSYRWLILRKGAGIKKFSELVGETVIGKRRALPEMELVMKALQKVFGQAPGRIKVVATTNTPQVTKALRAGSVAAAIMPFSRRSAQIQKPMNDGVIDFFYATKAQRDEALTHLPPMMWPQTFKAGTYSGQSKDVHIIGLNTYFMTRPGVSNETVYRTVRAILENTKEFATYHKAARLWTLKRTLKNVALPFHDGAIKYFKEKGVWTAALDANQKKLVRR